MEITSFVLNNFASEIFFFWGGGGQICNDEYTSKIPRMSFSTAWWKRSLTNAISPLTPGAFCKKCGFGHFVVFRLDLGQISFNLVENAFATQQLAFLATSIAFYHIVTRACAEIKIFRYAFRCLEFCFRLSFFSFFFFLLQRLTFY